MVICRVDNVNHQINHYPLGKHKINKLCYLYLPGRVLSGGQDEQHYFIHPSNICSLTGVLKSQL